MFVHTKLLEDLSLDNTFYIASHGHWAAITEWRHVAKPPESKDRRGFKMSEGFMA